MFTRTKSGGMPGAKGTRQRTPSPRVVPSPQLSTSAVGSASSHRHAPAMSSSHHASSVEESTGREVQAAPHYEEQHSEHDEVRNNNVDLHHRSVSEASRRGATACTPNQRVVGYPLRPPRSPAPTAHDLAPSSASRAASSAIPTSTSNDAQQPIYSELFEMEAPGTHGPISTPSTHRRGSRRDRASISSEVPLDAVGYCVLGQHAVGVAPQRLVDRTWKGRGGDLMRSTSLSNMPREITPMQNHISPFGDSGARRRGSQQHEDDMPQPSAARSMSPSSNAFSSRSRGVGTTNDVGCETEVAQTLEVPLLMSSANGKRVALEGISMCSTIGSIDDVDGDVSPLRDPLSGTHTARGLGRISPLIHNSNRDDDDELKPDVAEAVASLMGTMLQGVETARKSGVTTHGMYDVRTSQCVMCDRLMLTYASSAVSGGAAPEKPRWSPAQFREAAEALDKLDRRANKATLTKVASRLSSGGLQSPSSRPYRQVEGVAVVESVNGSPTTDNASVDRFLEAIPHASNAASTSHLAGSQHELYISEAPARYSFATTYAFYPDYYQGEIVLPPRGTGKKDSTSGRVKATTNSPLVVEREPFVCCWTCAWSCATNFADEPVSSPRSGKGVVSKRLVSRIRFNCEDTELGTNVVRSVEVSHQPTPIVILEYSGHPTGGIPGPTNNRGRNPTQHTNSDDDSSGDELSTVLKRSAQKPPVSSLPSADGAALSSSPPADGNQQDFLSPDGWGAISLSPLTPHQNASPIGGHHPKRHPHTPLVMQRYSPWSSLALFNGALFPSLGAIGGVSSHLLPSAAAADGGGRRDEAQEKVRVPSPPRGAARNSPTTPNNQRAKGSNSNAAIQRSSSPLERLSPNQRRFRLSSIGDGQVQAHARTTVAPNLHTEVKNSSAPQVDDGRGPLERLASLRSHRAPVILRPKEAFEDRSMVDSISHPFLRNFKAYRQSRRAAPKKRATLPATPIGSRARSAAATPTPAKKMDNASLENIRLQLSALKSPPPPQPQQPAAPHNNGTATSSMKQAQQPIATGILVTRPSYTRGGRRPAAEGTDGVCARIGATPRRRLFNPTPHRPEPPVTRAAPPPSHGPGTAASREGSPTELLASNPDLRELVAIIAKMYQSKSHCVRPVEVIAKLKEQFDVAAEVRLEHYRSMKEGSPERTRSKSVDSSGHRREGEDSDRQNRIATGEGPLFDGTDVSGRHPLLGEDINGAPISFVPKGGKESLANSMDEDDSVDDTQLIDCHRSEEEEEERGEVDEPEAHIPEPDAIPPSNHLCFLVGRRSEDGGEPSGGRWVSFAYPESYERSLASQRSRTRSPHHASLTPSRRHPSTGSALHSTPRRGTNSGEEECIAYKILPTPSPRRSFEPYYSSSSSSHRGSSSSDEGNDEDDNQDGGSGRRRTSARRQGRTNPATAAPSPTRQDVSTSQTNGGHTDGDAALTYLDDAPINLHVEAVSSIHIASISEDDPPTVVSEIRNSPLNGDCDSVVEMVGVGVADDSSAESDASHGEEKDSRPEEEDDHAAGLVTVSDPTHDGESPTNTPRGPPVAAPSRTVDTSDEASNSSAPPSSYRESQDSNPALVEPLPHLAAEGHVGEEEAEVPPVDVDWEVAAHILLSDVSKLAEEDREQGGDKQHPMDTLGEYLRTQQGISPPTAGSPSPQNIDEWLQEGGANDDEGEEDASYCLPVDDALQQHRTKVVIPTLALGGQHQRRASVVVVAEESHPTGTPRTPRLTSARSGGNAASPSTSMQQIPAVVPLGLREVAHADNSASDVVAAALLQPNEVDRIAEMTSHYPTDDKDDGRIAIDSVAFREQRHARSVIEGRLIDEALLGWQGWWRGRVLLSPLSCRHGRVARNGVVVEDGTIIVGGTVAPTPSRHGHDAECQRYEDQTDDELEWMNRSFRSTEAPATPEVWSSYGNDDTSSAADSNASTKSNDSISSLNAALGGSAKNLLAKTNSRILHSRIALQTAADDKQHKGENRAVSWKKEGLVFFSELPPTLLEKERERLQRRRHRPISVPASMHLGYSPSRSPPSTLHGMRRGTLLQDDDTLSSSHSSSPTDGDGDDADAPSTDAHFASVHGPVAPPPSGVDAAKMAFMRSYTEWMQHPAKAGRPEIPLGLLEEFELLCQQGVHGNDDDVDYGGALSLDNTPPQTTRPLVSNTSGLLPSEDEFAVAAGTDLPQRFLPPSATKSASDSSSSATSHSHQTTPRTSDSTPTTPRHSARQLSVLISGDSAMIPTSTTKMASAPILSTILSPRQFANGPGSSSSAPASPIRPPSPSSIVVAPAIKSAFVPHSDGGLTSRQLRNQRHRGLDETGQPLHFGSPRINNGKIIRIKFKTAMM